MNPPQADPGPASKSRLFCPDCGREGSFPEEWVVRTDGDRARTECPACGAVVDDRPRDRSAVEPGNGE
ncbi:hypothetical protein BRD00_08830 [Halobacteriales archaeon QS_8_69_26]|nr:MAG: hypothetical protein BRD00_08830 [Halobacteriales archaeon QS_8_69_26]